mgnify:FL=1
MDEKGRFVKFSPARHFLGGHQGYNQLHMTPLYDIHFPSPYPMCLVNLHGIPCRSDQTDKTNIEII